MKYLRTILPLIVLWCMCCISSAETLSFNADWKFARFGEMPDGSKLAEPEALEAVKFDDSSWCSLDVPHDWGIEGPFRAELPNRTGKLPWAGIGWYRKGFESPKSDEGKRVFIDFDGAMSRTKVWLNGEYIGEWPYGYSSFRLELTDHLNVGGQNVLAVRLDNQPESSRWYPGGGIYRQVRLVKKDAVHLAHWGTFVTTPEVSAERATVDIKTKVEGGGDATEVRHEIFLDGKMVVKGTGVHCSISVDSPKLWDTENPVLYELKTTVLEGGEVRDSETIPFGIRTIEFTASGGFLLNGKRIDLYGVCQHHDLGPLGTAVNVRALERQIEILQEMGCNAIRTSHNPPTPEFLDLCDRMGVLVQVEAFDCWKAGKTPNDYHKDFAEWHERDLRAMVKRDRNHACVIMWSTGNEIREQTTPEGHEISRQLTAIVKSEDTTRPVTAGCNNPKSGFNGFEKTIDLFGFNYKPQFYQRFLKENPKQPLYGSETASTISSRGEYFFPVSNDKSKGLGGYFQMSSYDLSAPGWANRPDIEFAAQDKFRSVFGEFVWTGFDYLGEPTPYNKDATNLLNAADPKERARLKAELDKLGTNIPPRSSYFGIVDLCGFKKDRFYLYQARWRPELPMAHILPHWNWPERVGEVTPVHVYTSGDEAELFLNGKSLGRKKKEKFQYRLRWNDVKYEAGALKVVAYRDGKSWAESEMKTTGEAAKIDLSADRATIQADGSDLSFVTVQVSDGSGLLVPRTHNSIKYSLSGPGEIIAVGNGDPTNHESFQATERKVFNGLALVVIRSKAGEVGAIRLVAESEGLESSEIQISAKEGRQ